MRSSFTILGSRATVLSRTETKMEPYCSSNKKRKIGGDSTPACSVATLRRWENFDVTILKKIFGLLSTCEITENVPLVCRSWRLACLDLLYWSHNALQLSASQLRIVSATLRMRNHPASFKGLQMYKFAESGRKLVDMLPRIMEGNDAYGWSLDHWRQSIRTLSILGCLLISDANLLYIARRTQGLETLQLLGSMRITTGGFAEAMPNWRNLKYLSLGYVFESSFPKIIKAIGNCCRGLMSLHLNHKRVDGVAAHIILKYLPQLRILKLEASWLLRGCMEVLFSYSHKLSAIHVCESFLIVVDYTEEHMFPSSSSFRIIFKEKGHWSFEADKNLIKEDMDSKSYSKFKLWMTLEGVEWSVERAVADGYLDPQHL
ncbi:hypothetical protein Tsubulata_008587 [Turnera subulata]|uniref:F-box domain-containing protein n=1 Tax=Turnera subulata TaxID=218843 RepID=A0A9Q0F8V0_9ROSI|nr:hypothetical protein Tsubulata_008587 [Turnera subulata]